MPWGKLLKIESRRYTRLKITLLDTTRNLAWPDWNLCFSCFWTRLNFGFLTQLYLWMAPCSSTTTLAPKRTYPPHPLLEVRAPIAALFGDQGHLLQIAIEYIYIRMLVCVNLLESKSTGFMVSQKKMCSTICLLESVNSVISADHISSGFHQSTNYPIILRYLVFYI